MESKDLEFHYVISYREGIGWSTVPDVEEACFTDGTIYDYDKYEWFFAWEDSEDEENASIADLDTAHYRVVQSMLRTMNGE